MDEYESPDYYRIATSEQELQLQSLNMEEQNLVEMLRALQQRKLQLQKEGDRLNRIAAEKAATTEGQGTSKGTETTTNIS